MEGRGEGNGEGRTRGGSYIEGAGNDKALLYERLNSTLVIKFETRIMILLSKFSCGIIRSGVVSCWWEGEIRRACPAPG